MQVGATPRGVAITAYAAAGIAGGAGVALLQSTDAVIGLCSAGAAALLSLLLAAALERVHVGSPRPAGAVSVAPGEAPVSKRNSGATSPNPVTARATLPSRAVTIGESP